MLLKKGDIMKEKLIKLFFEEENVVYTIDSEIDEDAEFIIKENDIKFICKISRIFILLFFSYCFFNFTLELFYPLEAYTFDFINRILIGTAITLFFNNIVDYFYINEMTKISKKNINRNLIKKIVNIFLSLAVVVVFSVSAIIYGIIQIALYSKYIYCLILVVSLLMIIMCFIIGFKLVDYLDIQFLKLNKETEGIV